MIPGGVEIEHDRGLRGHSDADALFHAAIDAVLGACGADDIGTLFPDDDDAHRGADSAALAVRVRRLVEARGFRIVSLDTIVVAERPKLAPHRPAMRGRLAEAFGVDLDRVNVKAKTGEGVGPTGRQETIEASAVALVTRA
ncbi:MAG: 2-C-methyl-D-erythritol 2,4-cyclodiphosphate synthase [Planctomycetota bacterium JB042]